MSNGYQRDHGHGGEQGHDQYRYRPPLVQGVGAGSRGPPSPSPPPQPPLAPQSQSQSMQPQPSLQPSLPPLNATGVPPNNRAPPRRVDHTYRDYSNFPLAELPAGKKAPTNFPSKLHQILSTHEYSHIISWMPHGRAWKIHNKELLMREVVPKYFVQSKYESFTRQLNGWGFKRLHQSGNDFNAYYHECFLRELPHLTVLMKRVPQNQGKLLPYVEGEPNFYEIEKQFRLPPQMPYHEHYPYPPSHMAGAGYGAPPEPPLGYHNPRHYPAYPAYNPPPPAYYPGHHGGDPNAVGAYAPQSNFQPYPYYPNHYTQMPPPEHYPNHPYPPGSPYASHENPPLNYDTGLAMNGDALPAPAPQRAVQAPPPEFTALREVPPERLPIKMDSKEEPLEPLSIFTESGSTTTESDFGKDTKK